MQVLIKQSSLNNIVNDGYLDGLRKHDARPLHPIVVPRDTSPGMMRKMMFEHQLLEERALHEFSAGRGDGAGVDTGSAPLKPAIAPAAAFPASITITGSSLFANTGPLLPVAYDSFIDAGVPGGRNVLPPYNDFELGSLVQTNPPAAILPPLRVYADTVANGSGGYDYIYMCYLELNTSGYYTESVAPGRWFIGNGYSFSNDNSGYYTNYGYYTALQSKSTPPTSNIANWTRVAGYYNSGGTISNLTFNY